MHCRDCRRATIFDDDVIDETVGEHGEIASVLCRPQIRNRSTAAMSAVRGAERMVGAKHLAVARLGAHGQTTRGARLQKHRREGMQRAGW